MTWHVVAHAGEVDGYTPMTAPGDPAPVAMEIDTVGGEFQSAKVLQGLRDYPNELVGASVDLLTVVLAAYTADLRTPRKSGYDRWTRDIRLHVGVNDPDRWRAAHETLARTLTFLTGDRWTVDVRPNRRPFEIALPPRRKQRRIEPDGVALFSGGLDSYVGALDLLASGQTPLLVGHHAAGGQTSKAQSNAIDALRRHTGQAELPFIQCYASPRVKATRARASEITTRGRSFVFLGLGTVIATAFGLERLIVPENGFISLNVPLTSTRLGSFSTKTTHPHLIGLFQQLLTELGLDVILELPYRFQTKGEMLRNCQDGAGVRGALEATMSCSHPGASRFETKNPFLHCGYCVPCLIRRAAAQPDDPTAYRNNPDDTLTTQKGSDLRAVRMALARYAQRPPTVFDVIKGGPLPGDERSQGAYTDVFRRGLEELRQFLEAYKV